MTVTKIPGIPDSWHLDYEQKESSLIPIVARSLIRNDESAPSTASVHIPRHSLDDDEASMCSEPGEESAFSEPPVF